MRKRLFTKEATAHPAKMSLALCRDLFLRYTQPGQTVLDPFGGIGSSLLGAALPEPRNVILHELEQNFVALARGNWDKIKSRTLPGMPLGDVTILQGDSRHLPLPDAECDVACSSPPFADVASRVHSTEPYYAQASPEKRAWLDQYGTGESNRHIAGYGHTPGQIGSLSHDSAGIAAAVASPPFGAMQADSSGGNVGNMRPNKDGAGFEQGPRENWVYSEDTPGQIGNLSHMPSAILSSHPYADTQFDPGETNRPEAKVARLLAEGRLREAEVVRTGGHSRQGSNLRSGDYGHTPGQIGSLSHTPSAILSSPPYGDVASRNRSDEPYSQAMDPLLRERYGSGDTNRHVDSYGASSGQIGNLHHRPEARRGNQYTAHPLSPAERFWKKVDKSEPDGCWLWTGGLNEWGYGTFRGVDDQTWLAHRFSWVLEHGDVPEETPCVLHRCDTPRCVRPDHLWLGTNAENMADRDRKGRQQQGERHHFAKLTEQQVSEIRRRWQEGDATQVQMAREYGVSTTAINSIVHARKWKSVDSTSYGASAGQIGGLVHAALSSPPYANATQSDGGMSDGYWDKVGGIRHRGEQGAQYGASDGQIGNDDGESYSQACLAVYRECFRIVRPGGVLVLVTGNYVREGKLVDLAADTIQLAVAAGWTPVERWVHAKSQVSFWRRLHAKRNPEAPTVTTEDVLVFVKHYQGWPFVDLAPTTLPPASLIPAFAGAEIPVALELDLAG